MGFTVRVGEPDVTHRTGLKAQVNVMGDQRCLVSIALQKEANAALIGTKQDSMLLPNARVKGAIKQKVLFILNSIHVAMATDVLTYGWFHRGEPPIMF